MLPWASFNCEHFDFSTSFPRKFTKPASISSELFKPFHKCAFLVRLNVSRLNVRFSKVISFPSRKQVRGFDVCPKAQLRKWCWAAALHGQSWLAKLASAARAGAVYNEGRSEVGSCHPEELCLWKGEVCVIPSSSGVSYLVSVRCTFCADCWRHGRQNCWHRWPSRGL